MTDGAGQARRVRSAACVSHSKGQGKFLFKSTMEADCCGASVADLGCSLDDAQTLKTTLPALMEILRESNAVKILHRVIG